MKLSFGANCQRLRLEYLVMCNQIMVFWSRQCAGIEMMKPTPHYAFQAERHGARTPGRHKQTLAFCVSGGRTPSDIKGYPGRVEENGIGNWLFSGQRCNSVTIQRTRLELNVRGRDTSRYRAIASVNTGWHAKRLFSTSLTGVGGVFGWIHHN